MDRKFVYILLTDTGTLFTRTIKQYTKAPYNHTSISFDKNLSELYSFGRRTPRNPINAGFVEEDVVNGTYKHFPNTTCVLYELEVDENNIRKMKRIINYFLKNKESYSYNILGIIGVIFNEAIEPSGSYFCSQFVAEVFMRSGLAFWDKKPSLVVPNDFRKIPKLKLIFEGRLNEYEPIKRKLKELDVPYS